jgi:hypothetical protein
MRRVFPATVAELLEFDPIRSGLPVFGLRVVPLFAITALHRNNFSGHIAPRLIQTLVILKARFLRRSVFGRPYGAG